MIHIGNQKIGLDQKPFVIAEMSGNHNQSLEKALKITEAIARCGADAIKLQTYTADTLTLDIKENEFLIKDEKSIWKGKALYDLYKGAYTPWDWHEPIMHKANDLGLMCFSTPFDETAVDFLEDLNVPAYKISSFENIHLPLIKKVVSTGKPIIISTGMASLSDIEEITNILKYGSIDNFVLLKCSSTYPAATKDSNVITIPYMRKLFSCEVGLSDHTLGLGASIAAIAHGATVIEKHFTLSRDDGGVDAAFSMEPEEMKQLITELNRAWESLGDVNFGPTENEKNSLQFRRSLYISEDIKNGELLNEKNLRIIRPGLGLHPKFFDIILGMKVNRDVKKGTPVSWDLIR